MRKLFCLLLLAFALPAAAQVSVVFQFDNLPAGTAGDSVFVAGTMNSWNPASQDHRSLPAPDGPPSLYMSVPPGMLTYKFTHGGWNKVEATVKGDDVENRTLQVTHDTVVHVTIQNWKDRFAPRVKRSTALPRVRVLSDSFFMPQLGRYRRVWVYLPKEYAHGERHYPVLYMHDGQNLFDDSTAGFGEWGVDEALDTLEQRLGGVIVVGIDHGGDKRLNEYCPYDMERFGKGEGRAYTDFLVQTLKPYIDRHFRTRRDRANTWIAGSSMGGLISLYAHLRYPGVFGASGVFSPAFWIAPELKKDLLRNAGSLQGKVYFYAGDAESDSMVGDMLEVEQLLRQLSHAQLQSDVRAGAHHNEAAWRQEFPLLIAFLMKKEAKPFAPRF